MFYFKMAIETKIYSVFDAIFHSVAVVAYQDASIIWMPSIDAVTILLWIT